MSSTFDQEARHHVNVSELVLERAQRLAEDKQDVVILMDSITRLARAYNIITSQRPDTQWRIDPRLYTAQTLFGRLVI